ncbi:ClpP/crotonase, partial [Gymnopus androsaceus JB14]
RFWQAYGALFNSISEETSDVRAVVLSSTFHLYRWIRLGTFSNAQYPIHTYPYAVLEAGDLAQTTADADSVQTTDPARVALDFPKLIKPFQEAITAPERCLFPVIAAIHGIVVGLGVDIVAACDIRYAASNARFSIKEIDISLAADMGTLAYLPKITGNMSLIREMAYTAQFFSASKAEQMGLVSKVVTAALDLAKLIAMKSPVAVSGTKRLISHARDHSVAENLEYTSTWNSAMLQTNDMMESLVATKAKQPVNFLLLNYKFGLKSKL